MTSRFSASTPTNSPKSTETVCVPHKAVHYHPNSWKSVALGLALGSTASTGFMLSGMILPQKTFHFFSLYALSTGIWDPSLLFTFCGALGTNAILYWATRSARSKPIMAETFQVPTNTQIDRRLVGGAALFGLGWGIGGFCPGPAIAAVGLGSVIPATFIFAGFLAALAMEGKLTSLSSVITKNGNAFWMALLAATLYYTPSIAALLPPLFEGVNWTLFSGLKGGLLGGSLIGASVGLYMLFEGKVFGFSGLFRGIIDPNHDDKLVRYAVLIGIILTSIVLSQVIPVPPIISRPPIVSAIGSFLVGVGVTFANGCTSGHGIAGMARFSVRSITATLTFMAFAMMTVTLLHYLTEDKWEW